MAQYNFDVSLYDNLIQTIRQKLTGQSPLILAIDGMCGSGKTTLAQYLSEVFDAAIIHMDNFFLPFERKTKERLSEAGGNIDYERFIEIILPALEKRQPFTYIAYNCQTASFDRNMEVSTCELIIVEGSYSLHKRFGHYYDLSLFLSVSPEEQLHRLKIRCQNDAKFNRFQSEWIPMENFYHEKQSVKQRADLLIHTNHIN